MSIHARATFVRRIIATTCLAMTVAVSGCATSSTGGGDAILYEGARLITGDGRPAVEDSAFLVERGKIVRVGRRAQVALPAGARRVDLSGKTVMPALIDGHVHPGFQKGLTYEAGNFTYDNVLADLERAQFFGISTVQSQGIERGDITYRIRADQRAGRIGGARLMIAGRGIGGPNSGPGDPAYAGIAYEVTTEEQMRAAVRELAVTDVDGIKIWVDDRGGRAKELTPALYRAGIDEAHRQGLKVTAHEFYLADAIGLADAGVDGFAHSVRDKVVTDAFVDLLVKRGTFFMANLAGAEVRHRPATDDPRMLALMKASIPAEVVNRVQTAPSTRDPVIVKRSEDAFAILMQSMTKLIKADVRIVTGPDTGLPDNFFGYSVHRELELFVQAGMTPNQAITTGTSRAAAFLRLNDAGSLVVGKDADFLVLDANPLDDIRNTRTIARMFVGGTEIDRAALGRDLLRGSR